MRLFFQRSVYELLAPLLLCDLGKPFPCLCLSILSWLLEHTPLLPGVREYEGPHFSFADPVPPASSQHHHTVVVAGNMWVNHRGEGLANT